MVAPLALRERGTGRAVIFAVMATSSVWLVIGIAVLLSGAAASVMGVIAEEWTANDLRSLRRRGWRVVQGLRLRYAADVDHIAIGPAGIVVVESKWRSDEWPQVGLPQDKESPLGRAIEQAARNRRNVESHFKRAVAGSPVLGALVLHSPIGVQGRAPAWHDDPSGVTIVEGGAVVRWMKSLDGNTVDKAGVRRVWEEAEKFAALRDKHDEASQGPARLTLRQLAWSYLYGPLIAIYAVGYYVRLLTSVATGWPLLAGLVAGLALGLLATRVAILRRAAAVWLVLTALFCAAWVADLVTSVLR
jgi:hypothetical protein